MFDSTQRAAFRVLLQRLGPLRALQVGLKVERQRLAGQPFELPPSSDWREVGSRQQAGPAILLYRCLQAFLDRPAALELTGEVVKAAGVAFLRSSLGPLRRHELAQLSPEAREARLAELAGRFPNATLRWEQVESEVVRFTVDRCRLVELVHLAGHPELGPLFCASDAAYFGAIEPNVVLTRPTTLAAGGKACPFTLRWADGPPGAPDRP